MSSDSASIPQHLVALDRANEMRLRRAAFKRQLQAGELQVAEVIDDEALASMPVVDLLGAQRRWGQRRARGVLRDVPCSEWKLVGQLTERQRDALLELLAPAEEEVASCD